MCESRRLEGIVNPKKGGYRGREQWAAGSGVG